MAILECIKPPFKNIETAMEHLQKNLNISKITSKILVNRGIFDLEEAKDFLDPTIDRLQDPFILSDMEKGVQRIRKAIDNKERVTIYGDYDVDGMTSSAILFDFLKGRGCPVNVYIPNRHGEGYGINCEAIKNICHNGTQLIISVDCGINSVEETELARTLGADMIITDHHQCGSGLPRAVAVINPARDPKFHKKHPLAGVGVVAKLVEAIGGISSLKKHMDLIALGTVADVVPLIGDNRIYVASGLKKINQSPCIGIEALIKAANYKGMEIDTGRIAFGLAPRLNAAGRIGDPLMGFKLLTTKEFAEADSFARTLEEQNRQRQAMEMGIIQEAQGIIETHIDLSTDRIIVLAGEGWDPGIIGIAAAKIAERYLRPCILIAISEDVGSGSARSISGFNIYEALDASSYLLLKFGGHEQAAGFSIEKNRIPALRDELLLYCKKTIQDHMLVPRFAYDVKLDAKNIGYDLINELETLKPFGMGNPTPTFLLEDTRLEDSRPVGAHDKHLKASIGVGDKIWDGIGFGMGERNDFLTTANRLSLVTSLEKNQWRGISKIQFNIKHMDVLLTDTQDWREFLSVFHFKLFDAFYEDFMYNRHYNNSMPPDIGESLSQEGIEEILHKFHNNGVGNLILVNSLANSRRIIGHLLDTKPLGNLTYTYNYPNVWDGIGVNGIVFAPAYSKIPFSNYRNIYIFQGEIPYYPSEPSIIPWEKTQKIQEESPMDKNNQINGKYLVEHQDFSSFYRWIRSLSPGQNIWRTWTELVDVYQRRLDTNLNGFKIKLMLKVFQDLNFVTMESGNKFIRIQCAKNPVPQELEKSPLYVYYKKWYSNILLPQDTP